VTFMDTGNPSSFNRYAYVSNNPIKFIDPDGRYQFDPSSNNMVDTQGEILYAAHEAITKPAIDFLTEDIIGFVKAVGDGDVKEASKSAVNATLKPVKAANKLRKLACFEAGTLVLTRNGKQTIETIKVGDVVWSSNPETGESGWKVVSNTFINDESSVWELTFADNEKQATVLHRVTGEHPYWVKSDDVWSWKAVAELKAGMVVETKSGKQLPIIDAIDTEVVKRTYNFEVEDFHTYYVGQEEILVHNVCKKNNRGGGDRQKGDRFKDGDDAEEQFRDIDRAQRDVRRGRSNQIIDDTSKSRQRADNALNDLKKGKLTPDDLDDFD